MYYIIANYDNLIKLKPDVENGKIDEIKTHVFGDNFENDNNENISNGIHKNYVNLLINSIQC